nr:DUF1552 domain-containing protein [Pirellula sp.]
GEFDAGAVIRATADAELAKLNPAPFNHLGLAIKGKALSNDYGGTMYPGISAVGPGQELPFQGSPDIAYAQLFGSAVSSNSQAEKSFKLQRNLLDFMVDDIKKVTNAIPASEHGKMDAYLNAFEELQVRHSKLSSMKKQIEANAPGYSDKFTSTVEEVRQEAQFDLATASLIAGLTNVVTIRLDNVDMTYKRLGIDEDNHGIGHNEGTRSQEEYRNIICEHHSELLATMANKLRAVPEGDGNMLDNTMIIFLSDSSDNHLICVTRNMGIRAAARLAIGGRLFSMPMATPSSITATKIWCSSKMVAPMQGRLRSLLFDRGAAEPVSNKCNAGQRQTRSIVDCQVDIIVRSKKSARAF